MFPSGSAAVVRAKRGEGGEPDSQDVPLALLSIQSSLRHRPDWGVIVACAPPAAPKGVMPKAGAVPLGALGQQILK